MKEQGDRKEEGEACTDDIAAAGRRLHTVGTSEKQNAHALHWKDRHVLSADA